MALLIAAVMFWGMPGMGVPVQAQTIHIGYFPARPHGMPGLEGEPEGVAVRYFKRIAGQMGLKESDLRFSVFPLKRLLLLLEQDRVDMALYFAKNAEREAKLVYPRASFAVTQPSLAVFSETGPERIISVEDLLGLDIRESAGAFRSPLIRDNRLVISPLHGNDYSTRCFDLLLIGRIDACYRPDHYPFRFEADSQKYKTRIRVIPLPEPPIKLYSVFSHSGAAAFLKSYERALDVVKDKLTYEEAYQEFVRKGVR